MKGRKGEGRGRCLTILNAVLDGIVPACTDRARHHKHPPAAVGALCGDIRADNVLVNVVRMRDRALFVALDVDVDAIVDNVLTVDDFISDCRMGGWSFSGWCGRLWGGRSRLRSGCGWFGCWCSWLSCWCSWLSC